MSMPLSESAIVWQVADLASRRISRKVMTNLQRIKHTLSGDRLEVENHLG